MQKYTLIIAEKPDVANRIATALDINGKPNKALANGVPYYEAYCDGNIVIVPALGHLYSITSKEKNREYPIFDYQWVPKYLVERGSARIKNWLKVITDLAKGADKFVNGCDYDTEGSIIGYTILKYACGEKQDQAKRMKYSTLTIEELQESYKNILPKLDFEVVEAGLTRHEVDWLYGINLSRALTQAVKKNSRQYATLSTGRVQGPTLRFMEERETEIQSFVPSPYWSLTAKIAIGDLIVDVIYKKTFDVYAEATKVKDASKTKQGKIQKIDQTDLLVNPPVPFDIGALQSEAYKLFHLTPMNTAKILQRLYIDVLISYPRTSSQKLPPSIGYQHILRKLCKDSAYRSHSTELLARTSLKPNEGKKEDSAHPAIYPTGNLPQKPLDPVSRKVFDLVVKRFLAVFGEPAIRQNITVIVNLNEYPFHFTTSRTFTEGWFKFYQPYVQVKDNVLPQIAEGQPIEVKSVTLKRNFAQPPQSYNPRTLLLKMEKEEIGTKATRAAIIETLQERKYVQGTDRLSVSDLGFEVIEVLEKYCPIVVSSDMTRSLEGKMEAIKEGKETKHTVLTDAMEQLKVITTELKSKEEAVGTQLSQALQRIRFEEKTIGICPNCKSKLIIITSKKTGKRFVGCINYFQGKCSITYPLPQTGVIKPLAKSCPNCSAPIISVYLKRKVPWRLCINPKCPSKGAP